MVTALINQAFSLVLATIDKVLGAVLKLAALTLRAVGGLLYAVYVFGPTAMSISAIALSRRDLGLAWALALAPVAWFVGFFAVLFLLSYWVDLRTWPSTPSKLRQVMLPVDVIAFFSSLAVLAFISGASA